MIKPDYYQVVQSEDMNQGVAEGFPDDILAMAKKVSPNARIRGSRDEEIARRDAMLAQRAQDHANAPEPKGVSANERASLEAELQQLMPKYDRHYQMIDNYTQHMQAKHIADRVHEIQRKLKLGVAEGWDPEDDEQWSAEDPKDEMFGAGDAYKRGIQDYRKFMQTKVKPSNPYSYTKQARQADNWEKGFEDGRYKQDVAEGSLNELVDLESAYRRATEITKQIKYDDTVTQIIVQIQMLAEKSGIPEENLRYEIDQVYEAKSQLESAIYGLDEVFQDAMRQQQYDQENNEVDESQIFAGGGMGQSYRKFTPKSAGTMNEMPDTSGPVGTQPGGRRVYRPKSAGTNMKRESSILKGLRETGSTGTSAGSAGIGGGAMVGGPTTYEQEFDPFKRKGARRITAMTNEGKK
jgi:hypothetical protein